MSKTISAYACAGKGVPLAPFKYEAKPPGPKDVLIKISHCGICHSDIHTLDSGWGPTKYPVVPGHEIVGVVEEIGSDVTRFKVGDRVGVGAQANSCHQCKQCKVGGENLCQKGTFTYNATHPDGRVAYGGYAEAVIVPDEFTFKIPDGLPSAEAAPLLCAGITVFAPLKRHMTPGCRVGVIGIGGLGHLALQFAKALGAVDVTAITSSAKKVADLNSLGASKVLVSSDPQAMKKAARSLDVIICTANAPGLNWEGYFSLLDVGGKLCVVGVPEEPITLSLGSLIFAQTSLVGSLIGSPDEIESMLEYAAKHKVLPWIEKTPLSKCNEAIEQVRKNNVKYRFVLEI